LGMSRCPCYVECIKAISVEDVAKGVNPAAQMPARQ